MANEIYVDPNVTSAMVIQVAGECYQRVGGVPVAPQVFAVDGEFDNCGGCGGGCTISPTVISFVTGGGSGSVKVCGLTPNTTYSISPGCPGYSAPASITTDATGCATFTVTATSSAPDGSSCVFNVEGTSCSLTVAVGGCVNVNSNNHPIETVTLDFTAPAPSTANCSPSSAGYGCGCFAPPDGCTVSGLTPTVGCSTGNELEWSPPNGAYTVSIQLNGNGSWSDTVSGATYTPLCLNGVWPCTGLNPSWNIAASTQTLSMACYQAVSGGTYQTLFGLNVGGIYWRIKGGRFQCPCAWGGGSTSNSGYWFAFVDAPIGSGGYALMPPAQTFSLAAVTNAFKLASCPPVSATIS